MLKPMFKMQQTFLTSKDYMFDLIHISKVWKNMPINLMNRVLYTAE